MKERIVILKDKIKVLTSCDCFPANGYFTFKKEDAEVKQVPETWEELKTMCEELESKKIITTSTGIIIEDDCIEFHGLQFWKSGTISHETEIDKGLAIRLNRTPQQMWNIIKSLVGEE